MTQTTTKLGIQDILAIYRDMEETGIWDLYQEPPISVIERDLDYAVESYYVRRKWDPTYQA